jgi:hypothetical protein
MLIKAYGQFWNPDIVEWGKPGAGNKGELPGTASVDGVKRQYNVWNQRGIYTLHEEFRVVYVGKTDDQNLGKRLRDHLTDRFAGRWDMFSWYGIGGLTKGGVRAPGQRQVQPQDVNKTLESLAILIADPPLNRKRERLPEAIYVEQGKSPYPKTVRHYLEAIMTKLDKR